MVAARRAVDDDSAPRALSAVCGTELEKDWVRLGSHAPSVHCAAGLLLRLERLFGGVRRNGVAIQQIWAAGPDAAHVQTTFLECEGDVELNAWLARTVAFDRWDDGHHVCPGHLVVGADDALVQSLVQARARRRLHTLCGGLAANSAECLSAPGVAEQRFLGLYLGQKRSVEHLI